MIRLSFNKSQLNSSISSLYNLPKLSKVSYMSSDTNANRSSNQQTINSNSRPNLRNPSKHDRSRNMIVAACILVVIYMYPMIFKPMFGINTSRDDNSNKLEDIKNKVDEHRPSFMPEWSSPFGPKPKD